MDSDYRYKNVSVFFVNGPKEKANDFYNELIDDFELKIKNYLSEFKIKRIEINETNKEITFFILIKENISMEISGRNGYDYLTYVEIL